MENKFGILSFPIRKAFLSIITIIQFLVLLFSANVLFAAEWSIVPRIEISESYDDNVHLEREDSKQDDYITQVNPGVSLMGNGRYAEFMLDYRMQNVFYKENSDYDDTYHKIQASAKTELIRDKLFLDASADRSQRTIDSGETASVDNLGITDNRTDIVVYRISPYFIHSMGQSVLLRMQHTYTEVDSRSEKISDTDTKTNTSYFELRSGPAFKRFHWQMSHKEQVTEYNERPDVESEDDQLFFRYWVTNKTYFVGVAGYEKYNYDALPDQDKPEGSYWEAGIGWTPSQRTRFEARKGEHYYGETKKLLFNHRTRRTIWAINYSQDINTTSRVEAQPDSVLIYNPETREFEETYAGVSYSNVPVVSLSKTLTISVSKTTGKSELALNIFKSRRKYLEEISSEISTEEQITDIKASFDWNITSRSKIKLQESLTKNDFSGTTIRDAKKLEIRRHEIRLERDISTNTSTYFSYANITQKSNLEGVLYNKNVYKIGLVSKF